MKAIIKQPLFIIGASFLLILLLASFYHYFVLDNKIPQTLILYDKDGSTPIGHPPFEPSTKFWFGTDQFGNDYFYKIIGGAKYTIGLALLVSLLRIFLSFLGGVFFSITPTKLKDWFNAMTEAAHYVPLALFIYIILYPVLVSEDISFWEKGFFQILMLTLVAVPTTSVLIGAEIDLISKKEFITGAKVLGGSRYHLFKKHIFPHLFPKLTILFIQQIIYVLMLLAHLGLLRMFFGGTLLKELVLGGVVIRPVSISHEWSGLIGAFYDQLIIAPWLMLIPVVFFSLTIISINFILEGVKQGLTKTTTTVKKLDSTMGNISSSHTKQIFKFIDNQNNAS